MGAQVAFENVKPTIKDLTEWVNLIIPHFQVKSFKPGDTVAMGIFADMGDYVKGMENFPIKSVYKGISTYNGKTVML